MRLRWTRAPGAEACIDAAALGAAVAVVIEAHVAAAGGGWRVAIAVRDAGGAPLGERVLDEPAADCGAIDEALTLVLALIIDPDAAAPPRPSPSPSPSPQAPWRFGVTAQVVAAAGLLPGASAGGAVAIAVDPPRVPAAMIRASAWSEDEARVGAAGAHFENATLGLSLCPRVWGRGAVTVAGCGGGELARMTARGFGFDRSERSTALVGYAVIEPRASIRVRGAIAIEASVGAWIPLVRPRFTFDQGGTIVVLHQPPPVSVVAGVGLGVHF